MIKDEFELEIRTRIDGVFVIGENAPGSGENGAPIASDLDLQNDLEYEWVSIKEGVLSINIKRGVDDYTGALPLPIPSVGVMQIKTINKLFDPQENRFIQPKAKVRLRRGNVDIFVGRLNNLNVDYRSDKDKPLITFDVMDPIAELQQCQTELSTIAAQGNQTWTERIETLFTNAKKQNYITWKREAFGGGKTKHGFWKDTKTLWEALILASDTEGAFIYYDKANKLNCYASGALPTGTLRQSFSNIDNTKFGYKNIGIEYNVTSTINEVQAQNTYGKYKSEWNEDADAGLGAFETVEEVVTDPMDIKRDDALINRYGTHALSANTNFNLSLGTDIYTSWATEILSKWKNPKIQVNSIEWDAKNSYDIAANAEILDRVNIQHKLQIADTSPTAKVYEEQLTIIGIQHELSADGNSWRVKYILFPRSRFI